MKLTHHQKLVTERPDIEHLGTDARGRPVVRGPKPLSDTLETWALLKNGDPTDVIEPVVVETELEEWRGTDSETTTRQKMKALSELEANVRALRELPLQELDLEGLRVAVRKTAS